MRQFKKTQEWKLPNYELVNIHIHTLHLHVHFGLDLNFKFNWIGKPSNHIIMNRQEGAIELILKCTFMYNIVFGQATNKKK